MGLSVMRVREEPNVEPEHAQALFCARSTFKDALGSVWMKPDHHKQAVKPVMTSGPPLRQSCRFSKSPHRFLRPLVGVTQALV